MVRFPFGRLGLVLVAAAVAAPALSAQEGRPETHTVKSGDTLWDLARRYLNDPFLWPEIYRLNTIVVEDPHWIYPGEVLRLRADGDVASVPSVDTPLPTPLDSAKPAQGAGAGPAAPDAPLSDEWKKYFAHIGNAGNALGTLEDMPYRALRPGEFHSSGFLTENRDLPYGEVLGRVTPLQIRANAVLETATLHTELLVRAPRNGTYQAGDSLLLVRLGERVPGFGRMVVPTGIARVKDVGAGRTVAIVTAVYGAIRQGDLILPVERFAATADTVRAAAVADGVQARVLGGPLAQTLVGPQDVLFLDKGSRDGVAAGDIFEVRRAANRRRDGATNVPEVMALLQVVRVGERSSTTRVIAVSSPNVDRGTESRQIARRPS
jgi:hypothetical protein